MSTNEPQVNKLQMLYDMAWADYRMKHSLGKSATIAKKHFLNGFKVAISLIKEMQNGSKEESNNGVGDTSNGN